MIAKFYSLFRKYRLFLSQQPPILFVLLFFPSCLAQFLLSALNRFAVLYTSFYGKASSGAFTSYWFDQTLSLFWFVLLVVRVIGIFRSTNIHCLELGSWEGRSSLFILDSLPTATLHCVDTWAGADEHQELAFLSDIKSRFCSNLSISLKNGSCVPYQLTTDEFLGSGFRTPIDFCYVDASHSYQDALNDLFNVVVLMKPFSFVVFDDYLWNFYGNPLSNCGHALNVFVKASKNRVVIPLFVSYQVVLLVV